MAAAGTLYLVSTPIGNLADTTIRAVETLSAADLILAEDTRRTRILLDHHGIDGADRLLSFHQHNAAARTEEVGGRLAGGATIALVSDSGTPLISDPGTRLVRLAIECGARVVPIPGPSAILAALVGSGLDPQPFTFLGFLPRSGRDREEAVSRLRELDHTAVLFESPHRLVGTLEQLVRDLGEDRPAVIARELTKVHEEYVRGTLGKALAYYREHEPRGEIVICLGAALPPSAADLEAEAQAHAVDLARSGATSKEIVRELKGRWGLSRNRAYELALEAAREDEET